MKNGNQDIYYVQCDIICDNHKNKNNQLLVLSFKIFVHIITSYINIITDIIMLSFLVNRVCNNTLVTFLDGRNTCDNVVIAQIKKKTLNPAKCLHNGHFQKQKLPFCPLTVI